MLNKTFFEIVAIITGLGGVYYTLYEAGSRALLMDTFSVASAIAALMIGVDHLQYVREHDRAHKAVVYGSIAVILIFILIVWTLWRGH